MTVKLYVPEKGKVIELQVGPGQLEMALVMLNFINLIKNCVHLTRKFLVIVEEYNKPFNIHINVREKKSCNPQKIMI